MHRKTISRILALTLGLTFMLAGTSGWHHAAWADGDEAPGRTMAQQAVKAPAHWNTTDHSKHAALNQPFKSGAEITAACLSCHSEAAAQFHTTIHWTWQASPDGAEAAYGKAAYSLNNFCISANKGADKGCLSCHPGWGKSTTSEVNCLNCHSRKKMNWDEAAEDLAAFIAAGDPDSLAIAADIQAELQASAQSVGLPQRQNCGGCHFTGGGGDGVKHGDLDTSLIKPAKTLDVHMGHDGQNFDCVRCHTTSLHNISGRVYTRPAATDRKSLVEDDLTAKITCESCHTRTPHEAGSKANDHTDRVACQTCHIPFMARELPTKMSWDWSQAGQLKDGKPFKTQDEFGRDSYLTVKGQMKWAKNVVPEYHWYNGAIGSVTTKDMIDPGRPVAVSWPEGGAADVNSRIHPFKVHHGKQPYDTVNKTLLAPLLSGPDGYWKHLDWQRALAKGQEALGLPYSGQFDFVETTYVFPTTHMVAPKESALACNDCHVRQAGRLQHIADVYMPGRDRFGLLDTLGWALVAASLVGVLLHGTGRLLTNGRKGEEETPCKS